MAKGKIINLHVINDDTTKQAGRTLGNSCYLAFDFEPKSKKAMIGIIVKDKKTALALAKDFKNMAKVLE